MDRHPDHPPPPAGASKPRLTRREFLAGLGSALALSGVEATASTPRGIPHRTLGKTGVHVPILGFGTAAAGYRRNLHNLHNGIALFNEAIDLGVTYFDTAPLNTGYGISQKQLGYVLRERRKEVFVVTKVHVTDGDEALRILEQNLKELQTDHVDLVHVHSLGDLEVATVTARHGLLPALYRARQHGLTRFIGLSGHSRPRHYLQVLQDHDIDVVMNAVNLADRYTYGFESRVWSAAARKNVGLVAMKVFGGANWNSRDMVNSMMPAQHHDLAFRYALSIPQVSVAVIGMATSEELHQNVQRARRFSPLSPGELQSLRHIGQKLALRWGPHFGPVA